MQEKKGRDIMSIKEMREAAKLTQKEFAEYFKISRRTVENWECGRTKPPDYLVELMEYKLKNEDILKGEPQ